MTFKVGDVVVCVDATDCDFPHVEPRQFLERGAVYVVRNVAEDRMGKWVYVTANTTGWYPWRFVKLPREKVDGTVPEAMPIEVGVE